MNLRDNKGNTPVSLCTAAGRTDLVQLLIDSGADLLKTNDVGDSALDIAKKRRLNEVYSILENATKEQQNKLEEQNQAREERRRQRNVIENNRNNSGVNRDNEGNGQEDQRFPAHLGNWRIIHGQKFFPISIYTSIPKYTAQRTRRYATLGTPGATSIFIQGCEGAGRSRIYLSNNFLNEKCFFYFSKRSELAWYLMFCVATCIYILIFCDFRVN